MQKTKLILMTVLAALIVCSAFSVVAAEEQTEIGSAASPPDGSTPSETSEPIMDPDATLNPDDSRSLEEPTGYGDDILYTIQDDNGVDKNSTGTDGEEPQLYGDEIYATGASDTNNAQDNTTLYITVGGVVAAIGVGGALGFVYYRKTKA